jgi:hypothetical protein
MLPLFLDLAFVLRTHLSLIERYGGEPSDSFRPTHRRFADYAPRAANIQQEMTSGESGKPAEGTCCTYLARVRAPPYPVCRHGRRADPSAETHAPGCIAG